MDKRINTTKMLSNDSFYTGGMDVEVINTTSISISPLISDRYDYSVTEDAVMLQEREDTERKLYDIYITSPFATEYIDVSTNQMKIPKEDVKKVFYYMKTKLDKIKKLSAFEITLAINEFFDFNYEYVVKKVLDPRMLAEIYEDYYLNMGMANRIDEDAADKMF